MKRTLLFICFYCSSLCFIETYALNISIVKNHQPSADIVISNSATVQIKNAAKILQQYILKSTGALLPVTSSPKRSTTIEIGNTSFVKSSAINISKLDEDGFIVNQTDGYHIA